MDLFDMFKIAFDNMKNRRLRSWLTLIGIFAGIATIVALVSLGQGLERAVTEQFASLGVNTITVTGAGSANGPPGTNAVGELNDADIRLIEEFAEVDYVIARYVQGAVAEFRDERETIFVASVPERENTERLYELLNLKVDQGRFLKSGDNDKIFIGSSVDFDEKKPVLGNKVTIDGEVFDVAGIMKRKGNPIFDNSILMMEDTFKELKGVEEDYSFLVVSVKEGEDVVAVQEAISNRMRKDRDQKPGEEDFELSTPQESLNTFNEILTIIQILLFGIAAISLVVGGIGILNTMYTAVLERRQEIGIMKSIGGKKTDILGIFLIESGLLGLAGGLLGLGIGALIGKGVELAAFAAFGESIIKTDFPIWLTLGSIIFAFGLGTLAGYLPARRASRLQPVDALKK